MQRLRLVSLLAFVVVAGTAVACGGGGEGADPGTAPEPQESPSEDPYAAPPLEVPGDCPKASADLEVIAAGASWVNEKGKAFAPLEQCLTAPADKPLAITLEARKVKGVLSFEHNVAIYADSIGVDEVFKGEFVKPGKKTTYDISPLASGVYLFRCDLHARLMKAVLLVE